MSKKWPLGYVAQIKKDVEKMEIFNDTNEIVVSISQSSFGPINFCSYFGQ